MRSGVELDRVILQTRGTSSVHDRRIPQAGFAPRLKGTRSVRFRGGTEMSAGEKAKAKAEQVVGKTVRKAAHAAHKETLEAKGAALEARGMMRGAKERAKGSLKS